MGTVVFDNDGRRWNAKSPALRAVVPGPPAHLEFLTYLVDVLGFVAVTRSRHGVTWIHLRPTRVSQVSLGAALFALADRRPSWVVVSHPSDRCDDELFSSLRSAFDRIAELVSSGQTAADDLIWIDPTVNNSSYDGFSSVTCAPEEAPPLVITDAPDARARVDVQPAAVGSQTCPRPA